jgi:hypothetical protein
MKPVVRELIIIVVCLFLGYLSSQYVLKEIRNETSTSK